MMNSKSSSTTQLVDLSELPELPTSENYTLNMIAKEMMGSMKQPSYFATETVVKEFSRVQGVYEQVSEENEMSENDLLKAYMDKISQDQSDIRSEVRESEKRISERVNEIEKRMDARLNRIEDMITSSTESMDTAVDKLKESVDSKMRWVVGTSITTILGIAAMVVTAIVTIA